MNCFDVTVRVDVRGIVEKTAEFTLLHETHTAAATFLDSIACGGALRVSLSSLCL